MIKSSCNLRHQTCWRRVGDGLLILKQAKHVVQVGSKKQDLIIQYHLDATYFRETVTLRRAFVVALDEPVTGEKCHVLDRVLDSWV